MSNAYHVMIGTTRRGPLTPAELAHLPIGPETPMWHAGLPSWVRAEQIPELTELLASLPPPGPPSPPRDPACAIQDGDWLIGNPRLPKMARLITLYALILNPALWLFQNLTCLFGLDQYGESAFDGWMLILEATWALISLAVAIAMAVGGWKLRGLRASGHTWIVGAAVGNLAMGTVLFIAAVVVGATVEQPEGSTSTGFADILQTFLAIAAVVFEVIAVIWLLRSRSQLPLCADGQGAGAKASR